MTSTRMLFNKTRDKKDEGDFSDRRDNNKQVAIHQLVCLKSKLPRVTKKLPSLKRKIESFPRGNRENSIPENIQFHS